MRYDPDIQKRRSIRLREYDYSQKGAYFVTTCTWHRECLFGDIVDGELGLNEYGGIVERCMNEIPDHFRYVDVDETVIMPNHVHMILTIDRTGVACNAPTEYANYYSQISPKQNTLGIIIRSFKSAITKQINNARDTQGRPVWHRNYYERVIRNQKELYAVRQYIRNNPLNWQDDKDNPMNIS